MAIETFWNSSPNEVVDYLESAKRKKDIEFKSKVEMSFLHAEVTARNIACLFPQKGGGVLDPPHPWEYFPSIFAEEEKQYKQQKEMLSVEEMREQRRAFAEEYNRRRNASHGS